MSIYRGKLIELIAVENNVDKSILHIKLLLDQDHVEMFWEVDAITAESVQMVTNFTKDVKYRVSFQCSWDPLQKHHTSLLTRTYRDTSERVTFTCSEDFIDQLNHIKAIQEVNDVDNLSFLSTSLLDKPPEQYDRMKSDADLPKKENLRFTWVTAIAITMISALLFGYSSHAYWEKTEANNDELAQHMLVDEIEVTPIEEPDREDTSVVDEDVSLQPEIPFIELHEETTYSLPEGYVALTFDDGPSQFSIEIMNILQEYNVGGTFFLIGSNVKKHPDYVEQIHANGYAIGSHSMHHVNVSTLSYENQENELLLSSELIQNITQENVTMFRPPYGSKNEHTENVVHRNSHKMVLWNNDPKDWESNDPKKIIDSVRNSEVSGDIILLHESQAVIHALPQIIEYLQGLDLQIVNLQS
ncbi:polysaccharide deacetylase family protein [Ornithinibacillus salinisoli]|uniref:Polysaccharide deacetylase family protein n=1 Tax=Ornithinibacillus salinisoli TaxID=1848459 RepID=A0ABW4W5U0_9BACI